MPGTRRAPSNALAAANAGAGASASGLARSVRRARCWFAAALALCACALALAAAPTASEPIAVPKLTAHVVDLTGTLSAPEREALDAKLRAFEAARGSQVAVLVVPSIGSETIEEFAGRVTDEWKLGRKAVDDGVLFVIAKQERRMRIHTGRGVQGTLTDALSKRIISELVAPAFRNGDFAGGIEAGVGAIMKAVEGEALPLPKQEAPHKAHNVFSSDFFWFGLFLMAMVAMALRRMLGRFFGAGLTSGIAGLAAWFIFGSLIFGLGGALVAFLFTLFAPGAMVSGLRPGWGGGFSSGGGGGGGDFGGGGGFSGGGGSFDGGGSSGSW